MEENKTRFEIVKRRLHSIAKITNALKLRDLRDQVNEAKKEEESFISSKKERVENIPDNLDKAAIEIEIKVHQENVKSLETALKKIEQTANGILNK
jgi:hypothetical protein